MADDNNSKEQLTEQQFETIKTTKTPVEPVMLSVPILTPDSIAEVHDAEQVFTDRTATEGQNTFIDLLVHGQTTSSALFCAPLDEPLGIRGWKQLTLATRHGQWDVVLSSPTRRCHDFARLLALRLSSPFIVDERLAELEFGEWSGLEAAVIEERNPDLLHQYYHQPRRFVAPQGESMEVFSQRVTAVWEELKVNYVGQRVLVLTHAGVIKLILSRVLDILQQKSHHIEISPATFTRLQIYPDGEISILGHGLPIPTR